MTISRPDEKMLIAAFSIIDDTPNIDGVVSKLRNLLHVDHVVYHSSKLGASPSDPQRGPYIRLTYPASWIMRYLQMGYADVDPVLREAFRRTIPFEWSDERRRRRFLQTPSLMVLDLMASPSLFRASAAIGVTSESHLRGLRRSGQLFYELPAPP
jgi:hypothetical protein